MVTVDTGFERQEIRSLEEFETPEELYEELKKSILKYHPSADLSIIQEAYELAYNAHKQQLRKSGEPFIVHPLNVAIILADLEMDKETIVAGLLHDVVEDTGMSDQEVREKFGDDVAQLVDGVTKLSQLSYNADKVELQAENLRKMLLAMAKDIRVIIIKLADRLHNMRTLKYMSPEKQKEKARETMDIYAPIAQRLGISQFKSELEDLSLKYLHPDVFYDLVEKVAIRRSERNQFVLDMMMAVKKILEENDISGQISGRAKHFFSIYKKMVNQGKPLDQIYDLFAIRIIVDTVLDCYSVLGLIHENYTPVPGRFKDYIAMPKPNMYQSLHTTVIGLNGQPCEIQIRTIEMHKTAQYGIAAHWKYKEDEYGTATHGEEEKLSWLKQILEWQQDLSDNHEFLNLLKTDLDLFADSVFCFTPNGDVKNLPSGSTPIDFAYGVHSAVGNTMIGAKVNGKLVPLDYVIQNGDRVEILTSQNSRGPSRDWLNVAKSARAKAKINQWFKMQFREENIEKGHDMLIAYCKSKNVPPEVLNKREYQDKIQRKYGYKDWNAVLAAVGHGGLKEAQIVNRIKEEIRREQEANVTDQDVVSEIGNAKTQGKDGGQVTHNGIVVKGLSDVAVHFSRCCSPVPGDDIVGFITRGRGVSIHRTDCPNIMKLSDFDRARLIDAEWLYDGEEEQKQTEGRYNVGLKIVANNRTGLMVDVVKIFTEQSIDIQAIESRVSKKEIATIQLSFRTKGMDELGELTRKLLQVPSVIDVARTVG